MGQNLLTTNYSSSTGWYTIATNCKLDTAAPNANIAGLFYGNCTGYISTVTPKSQTFGTSSTALGIADGSTATASINNAAGKYFEFKLSPTSSDSLLTVTSISLSAFYNSTTATTVYGALLYSKNGTDWVSVDGRSITSTPVGAAGAGSQLNTLTSSTTVTPTIFSINLASSPITISFGEYLRVRFVPIRANSTAATKVVGISNVAIGGTVNPLIITTSTTGVTGLNYLVNEGPSPSGSFNVRGLNLTSNITLTAPNNFEIATSSVGTYGSSITLTQSGGTVASTPIFVRLKSGLSIGTYSDTITISSTGATATTKKVGCSGTVKSTTQYTEDFETSTLTTTNYLTSSFTTIPAWGNWSRGRATSVTNTGAGLSSNGIGASKCAKLKGVYPFIETPVTRGVSSISCYYAESFTSILSDTLTISDGGLLNRQKRFQTTSIITYDTISPVAPSNESIDKYRFTFGASLDTVTKYIDNITLNFIKPTTQDSALTATFNGTGLTLKWTRPNSGNNNQGCVVFAGTGSFTSPRSEVSYTANTVYGSGTSTGGNYFCVYNGTGSSVDITGLDSGTTYNFYALEYNGVPGKNDEYYNKDVPANVSNTYTPVPIINLSTSTTPLSYFVRTSTLPSAIQSFTLVGKSLNSTVQINAPADYEITTDTSSTSVVPFGSTISLTPVSGLIPLTKIFVQLKAGLLAGNYFENITLSTPDFVNLLTVSCKGFVRDQDPSIVINPTPLYGFNYGFATGPSAYQTLNLSATSLTDTIVRITSSSGAFEFSLNPSGPYQSPKTNPLVLSVDNYGNISSTILYVRIKADGTLTTFGPTGSGCKTYYASTSSNSTPFTLCGSIFSPFILPPTPGVLNNFGYLLGTGPSSEQSFTDSARVSSPVGIKASANFEISKQSGTGFADSLTLFPISDTSGRVALTTIYVRMKQGLTLGTYSNDTIVISSPATASIKIPCSGQVLSTCIWTGATNSNWNTPSNWVGGVLPSIASNDSIPASLNNPVIEAGQTGSVKNIVIGNNSSLTINDGAKLTVTGNLTLNGTVTNYGTLSFAGIGNQNFSGVNGSIAAMDSIEVNKSKVAGDTMTFNRSFSIAGAFVPTSGNIKLNNDTITLTSTNTGTASIGNANAASFTYTNNAKFIIERYIPTGVSHSKSWQLLSAPTFGQTIREAWMEGASSSNANPKPGYGTQTVGSFGWTNGFDLASSLPGVKTYDPTTETWTGISSTNNQINSANAYMIFVRGDRSVNSFNSPPTPTTLRTTGKIYSPSNPPSTVLVPAGKFQTIGNPYASAIDFLSLSNSNPNIDKYFYVWDPLYSGTYGGYRLFALNNGWNDGQTTSNYSGINTLIQSGQAVFVHNSGSNDVTLSFSEDNKVTGSRMTFRPPSAQLVGIRSFLRNANNTIVDAALFTIDSAYGNAYESNDAVKLFNTNENISIVNSNKILAIDARSSLNSLDTIYYQLNNLTRPQYQFVFSPENMQSVGSGMEVFLVDKYTKSKSFVSLFDSTIVNFDVNADVNSYDSSRFYLVFKTASALPVRFLNVSANRTENNSSTISWQVSNEINVSSYKIERSTDGIDFQEIGSLSNVVNNGNESRYNFTDVEHISSDRVFYRIRSIEFNGAFQWSKIVQLKLLNSKTAISILPNPIVDEKINIHFVGLHSGVYNISVFDVKGQLILHKELSLQSNNEIHPVVFGKKYVSGKYLLQVSDKDGVISTLNFLNP